MNTKNQTGKPAPIDKLLADKAHLERIIKVCEQNLGRDFRYIRDNSSSLIISGFTSMLFSSDKLKKGQPALLSGSRKTSADAPLKFVDYVHIGARMLPVVWEIAQPFVLTWGINTAKNWIGGMFTRKQKKALRA